MSNMDTNRPPDLIGVAFNTQRLLTLQYSSSAVCWPLQPYLSLLRGIGCAGEGILWAFKSWNNTLEMLLLPSTFLVCSGGEFPLNSQIAFFSRLLFILNPLLLWHFRVRTKAELNRSWVFAAAAAMMGWFQQSCLFLLGQNFHLISELFV